MRYSTAPAASPRAEDAEVLARELVAYDIRVSEDANDRFGAFKLGTHDDLVTALGRAVQIEPVRLGPSIAFDGHGKRIA